MLTCYGQAHVAGRMAAGQPELRAEALASAEPKNFPDHVIEHFQLSFTRPRYFKRV